MDVARPDRSRQKRLRGTVYGGITAAPSVDRGGVLSDSVNNNAGSTIIKAERRAQLAKEREPRNADR